jgi:hypothetical protein
MAWRGGRIRLYGRAMLPCWLSSGRWLSLLLLFLLLLLLLLGR